ncbi:S8 family serine peptidase [Mumia sp. ZJ430]|uniref:S8 family serine peptidase n=1 Tax=Mumia sp. ZJ430 TaxID=2708083 RepID=UPI00141FF692|nr:S8 family serine peptidase [Mumia sp. ZJ430]
MLPTSPSRPLRRLALAATAVALIAAAAPAATAADDPPTTGSGPDAAAKTRAAAQVHEVRSVPSRAAGLLVTYDKVATTRSSTVTAAARKVAKAEVGALAPATVPVSADTSAIRFAEPASLADAQKAAAEVAELPGIASVVPDRYRTIRTASPVTPNDTFFADQWALWDTRDVADGAALPSGGYGTHNPALWRATRGSSSVVVAVLDTGRTTHPDLDANTVAGFDMMSEGTAEWARDGDGRDADPADEGDWVELGQCDLDDEYDSSWHGTHVAGIVAAASGNARGIAGNAPGVKVQHVRVLGTCGGIDSDILAAITWASGGVVPGLPVNTTPAKVINMSFGGAGGACPAVWNSTIAAARARGSVLVAAAGNEDLDAAEVTPANCAGVVTVGATEEYGQRASYSNSGPTVDLSAPGGESIPEIGMRGVLSTLNDGTTTPDNPAYAEYDGTSMAVPAVSGAAALIASLGTTSPAQIESALRAAVQPFPRYGGDLAPWDCTTATCGTGILDLARVPVRRSAPAVSGAVRPGAVVRASAGTWIGGPSGFRYQWLRNGAPIAGATGASYRVQVADVGRRLAVRVTGVKAGFSIPTATSGQSAVVPKVASSATLVVKPKSTRYGRTRATLKATVRVGAGSPTGTVVFRDGTKVLKKAKVRAGRASYTLGKRTLKRGKHKITVTFVPSSGSYASARSKVVSLRVR